MQNRDLRIDLIKLIATMMVVILHTIENGELITCLWNYSKGIATAEFRYTVDSQCSDG